MTEAAPGAFIKSIKTILGDKPIKRVFERPAPPPKKKAGRPHNMEMEAFCRDVALRHAARLKINPKSRITDAIRNAQKDYPKMRSRGLRQLEARISEYFRRNPLMRHRRHFIRLTDLSGRFNAGIDWHFRNTPK
jgi:hypothetical protein